VNLWFVKIAGWRWPSSPAQAAAADTAGLLSVQPELGKAGFIALSLRRC